VAVIAERLVGVTIENRDAIEVMRAHDGLGTLHYVDPPYLPETRSAGNRRRGQGYHVYVHDMTVDDHVGLLDALTQLEGMVVLSGYDSALYRDALAGWQHHQVQAYADGARPRTECLWLNPACVAALGHGPLFSEAAE
jgi:DNA adenine methylase